MAKQFYGVHGTCEYSAISIRNNGGIKITVGGLAGNGFYMWAYASLGAHQAAVQLGRDWYDFYCYKRKFDHIPVGTRSFAALLCSIELLPGEWLDLETPTAHKGIAHILSGHPPGTSKYVACIQYIEEIADLLLKEYGIQLKMVMVGLPVPPTTRRKLGNPRLTFPADAYIVLEAGIQDLKILPR